MKMTSKNYTQAQIKLRMAILILVSLELQIISHITKKLKLIDRKI